MRMGSINQAPAQTEGVSPERRCDAVSVERFEGGYRITGLRRGRTESAFIVNGRMLDELARLIAAARGQKRVNSVRPALEPGDIALVLLARDSEVMWQRYGRPPIKLTALAAWFGVSRQAIFLNLRRYHDGADARFHALVDAARAQAEAGLDRLMDQEFGPPARS